MLFLLAIVGGVLPIALAWHFGALGIPRNDDWAYAHSAYQFADSAKVTGSGWAGMNLVGQLVLAYPVVALFGRHLAALQIEVAGLGVVGLFATYDLAQRLLGARRALFVALLVAVLPMWASLSASFMTDVPAFALAMVCLALGARAVDGPALRARSLGASLAVGFFAFTIRENAIVAPLAVGAVAVLGAGRRPQGLRRSAAVAAIVGLVVAAGTFFLWRLSLPGFIHERAHLPTPSRVGQAALDVLQSALLVALLVAPAIVLADPRRLWGGARLRAPRAALGVGRVVSSAAAIAMVLQWSKPGLLGPGDYLWPNGTLGNEMLSGARPDLLPHPVLIAAAIVSAVALVGLSGAVAAAVSDRFARFRRHPRDIAPTEPALLVVVLAAVGYPAVSLGAVALGYSRFFDRYLIPIVPLVAILVLRSGVTDRLGSRTTRVAGGAALAGLAVFGFVYAANSAAYDGAKWNVASRAAALAKDPRRVDGGHIWNDAVAGRHLHGDFRNACIVLRAGPRPAPGAAGVVDAQPVWGPTGPQVWVVARQVRPC